MEVSEKEIKITAYKRELENDLEIGANVVFLGHGEVVKEEHFNNQDGSIRVVYVVKPYDVRINQERL